MAEPIILDVDLAMGAPGSDIDDGFALALALAAPETDLAMVTTVNGNTDVDTATVLTLELLDRLGRAQVPVYRGAQRPLLRPQARQGSVPDGVPHREPQSTPAAAALVERVLAEPGVYTLVAVGPLTNVALAMRLHPEFAASLRGLMIMGGIFDEPMHEAAMPGEFNIWNDPEAARIVLESGISARWVGLDVTRQVRLTRTEAAEMAASDRAFESFAGQYTVAWIDHISGGHAGPEDSCALHDPLAVAAVIRPDLITWRDALVQVETGDRLRGAMLADYGAVPPSSDVGPHALLANAQVGTAVDAPGFAELFRTSISAL